MVRVGRPLQADLVALLARYRIEVSPVVDGDAIPGSYWGEPEAGIVGARLWLRADTPLHSALHEAGHLICMGSTRREQVHTDAGGDDPEECGVCYLQALLADSLPGYGRARLFRDMDDWGYSFRLGSARAWFESDAADARQWLIDHGLVDERGTLIYPAG